MNAKVLRLNQSKQSDDANSEKKNNTIICRRLKLGH